jgi:hypothetical protein
MLNRDARASKTCAPCSRRSSRIPGNSSASPRSPAGSRTWTWRPCVATALGLSLDAAQVVAHAQALGNAAKACLLAHGATEDANHTVSDPSGGAQNACSTQIAENESFLDSPTLAGALQEARPKLDAAGACFQKITGIPPGYIIKYPGQVISAARKAQIDLGTQTCFRGDGLPK